MTIITKEELYKKIGSGENTKVEFKAKIMDPKLLSKYISSFANAEGGKIYFGIDDNFKIVGSDRNKLIYAYESAKSKLKGKINTDLRFEEIDSKVIGIITVEKSEALISTTQGFYIRERANLVVMKPEEIKRNISNEKSEESLQVLTELVVSQTLVIEKLEESIDKGNKFITKFNNYVVAGIIGALLSIVINKFV